MLRRILRKLACEEAGQSSFEYMLVLGGVAVLIIAALILGFPAVVHAVAALACPSIDPASAGASGPGSCLL